MGNESNFSKYIRDVVCIKRKTKTIDCEAYLDVPSSDNPPLTLQAKWSRFVLTIIDKQNANMTKAIFCNVPARDIAYIMERFRIASLTNELRRGKKVATTQQTESGLCYSERFSFGNMQGKTPAEILLENAQNRNALLTQRDFLLKNVQKFPANQKMIDAINEGVTLFDNGKLSQQSALASAAASSAFVIYNKDYKFLESKKNASGKSFVYSVKMLADYSKDYPFSIQITNCFCAVEQTQTGGCLVKKNSMEDFAVADFTLSEDEFFLLINSMIKVSDAFDCFNSPMLFEAFFKGIGESIRVFDTEIPHSVRAAESSLEGRSIFAHDKSGKVAAAYESLTKEVMEIEQRAKNRLRTDGVR